MLSCALFGVIQAEARDCRVRLKQSLEVTRDSTVARHTSTLDHKELFDESRSARAEAKKDPDLKVTKGASVRTPEQIEAMITNFSNRLRAAKADPAKKMSLEEFFGMIDGGFGREGFHFEDIFKEFGITHVRLVGKGDFKSKIVKNGKGAEAKTEIYIEVPDFPVDKPEQAAFWIKDLYLTLHDASTNMIANKVNKSALLAEAAESNWFMKRFAGIHENITSKRARAIWTNEYKKLVRGMDRGVRSVLVELDAYLKSKYPDEKNPLDLSKRSLSPSLWYHAISLYKATDSVIGGELASKVGTGVGDQVGSAIGSHAGEEWGGFSGGLGGTVFGILTKVRFPLESWKPSQKWLLSKEAFEIERDRLDARLTSYYKYKATNTLVDLYAKGKFLIGTAAMGYFYYQNRSLTGNAEEGMHEEADKATKELDILTEAQLAKLNVTDVQATYDKLVADEKELNRQKAEAISKKDFMKAATLNARLILTTDYMKKVLSQLEALNPDGLEYER